MKIQTSAQRIKVFEKKQYIVSGLCLLIVTGLAIVFNALHLQNVAEENTRFLSRMVKIGDFREASLILQQARLSSFTMIQYKSPESDRSFVIPLKAEIFKDNSFFNRIAKNEIKVSVDLNTATQSNDEIIFEYERFRLVPYAFLIWFFLNLISIPQTRLLKRRLLEQFNRDIEIEKKVAKSEIAQQVRHNLRTPLAALIHIPSRLPEAALKERELLELTIGQIRDLISKLDDRTNEAFIEAYSTELYTTLDQAKRELTNIVPKSIQFEFDIEDIVASSLVKHIPYELRSVLGNVITNSVEAVGESGKILVQVRDLASEVLISVSDNGIGIKPEILPKVFQKHFSEGKLNGSGIGLSHAKENIESWGGSVSINSTVNVGTTVTITLPVEDRASWYLPRLKFNAQSKIFIVDDQESALELWKIKLQEADLMKQSVFSKTGEVCMKTFEKEEDCTYLFDYDLSQRETGLDFLRNLSKGSTRCLVTGNFDNQKLRSACAEAGIYLIPKGYIPEIPLIKLST